MKPSKRRRLRSAGWRVGTSRQFLRLTRAESEFVDLKLALVDAVRARRARLGLTQHELARRLGSSQSRVAKIEAGDATVSIDLLVSALFGLGATCKDLARLLAKRAA